LQKFALALALIVLLPVSLAAEVVTLGATAEPVSVRVLESTELRIVLEYDLGSFTKNSIEIDGNLYYTIDLGEESKLKEKGLPALPNVCRSIIIPDNAAMELRVVSSHYVDYEGVPVEPSKGIITRDVDPATVAYTFAPFYAGDAWYPAAIATARDPYIMRDYRGTVVELNPIQYNPSTQTLRVYDSVVVEAVSVGAARANPLTFHPEELDAEFDKIYRRHFVNYTEAGTRYPSVSDVGNMLVIAYGDFMDEMESFVTWKNQMGVPCEMVSVTDAGSSAAGIDAYIQQYYYDHGLTYVLLVGDSAQVPSLYQSDASDPSYTLITADTYPDLFIGRFSAENGAQVATQALRSVEYEKRPQAAADWYHMGTGVASNQGPGDDGEYDDEHLDNIRLDLLGFTYTEVDQIYDPTGTATMVSTGLNEGRSVINYTGHGSTTSWSSTGFSNTHVNALVNDNTLPWITSVACENGDFDSGTCFGEAWLRATNGEEPSGAIAFWGSTISQSWDPPMDGQDEVIDLLVGGQKWTIGGMCFNGCGHMMDEYGSSGVNEFYHWTIFGDPSIHVRTDTPADVDVAHLPVLYPGMATYDVSVSTVAARAPVRAALCTLYHDGTIYGSGTTDSSGNVTIAITGMLPVGEFVSLTVTAFNTATYVADIQVVVPVTYEIDPPTIPVSTGSDVTVTILDNEGAPKPDVAVTIDGWSIDPAEDTTDAMGEAHFALSPGYGEDLTVVGREVGESYDCIEDVLPVTGAASFTSADIEGNVPAIGLYGALAPLYEGTITGTASEGVFTLHAAGCGVDASVVSAATSVDLLVTPTSTGTISAAIGKKGFNVYVEDITVQTVYGQMAGEVYEGRAPIAGASIKGYAAGSDTMGIAPIFQAVTNAGGGYAVQGDLEVAYYDVYVSKFGYLALVEEVFLQYGANDVDYYLDFAPSSVVSGTVTEAGTGTPLEATVRVYRADNMQLYTQTDTDPINGAYDVTVPYFDYVMNVMAAQHIPQSRGITVDDPTEAENFGLDVVAGSILVIQDGPRREETVKVDENGTVIDTWSGSTDVERSASQIATDLLSFGYEVVQETAAASHAPDWVDYDFIVWATGDNTNPVAVAAYRTSLESYVADGGKLLIEGGELGYDALSYPGYPSFAANVLHIDDWGYDESGTITVYDASHPIALGPNTIGPITVSYSGYGDQDSNTPSADAQVVCNWSSHPDLSSVQVYDDTPDPTSGQIVYFSFDYIAAAAAGRVALLENTALYLTAQESQTGIDEGEFGDASSGYVLGGVSPNPFNPVTKVSYSLPKDGAVALKVYNVTGQLVRVLVDGPVEAGNHTAAWDGRDDRGVEAASGVYFCRMEAEGFNDSVKMLLLK
jgi:hypothetical protein